MGEFLLLICLVCLALFFAVKINRAIEKRKNSAKGRTESTAEKAPVPSEASSAQTAAKGDKTTQQKNTASSSSDSINECALAQSSQDTAKTSGEIILPQSLVSFLPDPDSISIISYADANQSFGRHYIIGLSHSSEEPSKPYVQYEAKENGADFDRQCSAVFASSFHPFIQAFTTDTVICSENMAKEFAFRPYRYEISENRLQISFNSGYYQAGYEETPNFITYSESYTESSHDGGGSGYKTWTVYAAPGTEAAPELSQSSRVLDRIFLPACKGHWFDGEHLYLVEPWGIPGIFAYYFYAAERRDRDSNQEAWTVGVKYSS